jgi:hypothetical protein
LFSKPFAKLRKGGNSYLLFDYHSKVLELVDLLTSQRKRVFTPRAYPACVAVVLTDAAQLTGGKANGYRNVWSWRDDQAGWKRVMLPAGAPQPDARWGHAGCVVGSRWFIHGGYDSNAFLLNDMWCFDFEACHWTRVEQRGKHVPEARQHHTLVQVTPGEMRLGDKETAEPPQTNMRPASGPSTCSHPAMAWSDPAGAPAALSMSGGAPKQHDTVALRMPSTSSLT